MERGLHPCRDVERKAALPWSRLWVLPTHWHFIADLTTTQTTTSSLSSSMFSVLPPSTTSTPSPRTARATTSAHSPSRSVGRSSRSTQTPTRSQSTSSNAALPSTPRSASPWRRRWRTPTSSPITMRRTSRRRRSCVSSWVGMHRLWGLTFLVQLLPSSPSTGSN